MRHTVVNSNMCMLCMDARMEVVISGHQSSQKRWLVKCGRTLIVDLAKGWTDLRRRETEEKSGSKADIANWTFALDLYRKWCRTVPGTMSVVLGRPWSTAALMLLILSVRSICCLDRVFISL